MVGVTGLESAGVAEVEDTVLDIPFAENFRFGEDGLTVAVPTPCAVGAKIVIRACGPEVMKGTVGIVPETDEPRG